MGLATCLDIANELRHLARVPSITGSGAIRGQQDRFFLGNILLPFIGMCQQEGIAKAFLVPSNIVRARLLIRPRTKSEGQDFVNRPVIQHPQGFINLTHRGSQNLV